MTTPVPRPDLESMWKVLPGMNDRNFFLTAKEARQILAYIDRIELVLLDLHTCKVLGGRLAPGTHFSILGEEIRRGRQA